MPVSTPSTNGASNGTSNGSTTTAAPVVPEEHHDKAVKVWQSLVGSRTISEDQVKDFYANWAETVFTRMDDY